ncbi:hypothetical protein LG045_06190 [Limosilactobacillus gastricus]|uniref:hypothetical protein n=1 Tax=Limosilactobacillus gastricus TaxID=227942 RepID=UPI000704DCF5|nr:hypothetical protein [Limosilactobacillus gastricus]QGF40706.1 hypothetical protein LG045_06190 [Limosilactobacillus gastricus]
MLSILSVIISCVFTIVYDRYKGRRNKAQLTAKNLIFLIKFNFSNANMLLWLFMDPNIGKDKRMMLVAPLIESISSLYNCNDKLAQLNKKILLDEKYNLTTEKINELKNEYKNIKFDEGYNSDILRFSNDIRQIYDFVNRITNE